MRPRILKDKCGIPQDLETRIRYPACIELRLLTSAEQAAYDTWVRSHPQGTLWQSHTWERFQRSLGRTVRVYCGWENQCIVASALIVVDRTSLNLSTWDIPRGPLFDESRVTSHESRDFLEHIITEASKDRCIALYISSLSSLSTLDSRLSTSSRHEQPDATRILDLTLSEEDLLKQMHQKGRYNIKVAEKNGVKVLQSTDALSFARLMQETASRDGFAALSAHQYQRFLQNVEESFLLLAMREETVVAGVIGVMWEGRGMYYYGASSYEHRSLMAPYLLQWEAMRHCKAHGCTTYDLLGVAPADAPDDHPWQGISHFKEKFGGRMEAYPHEQQLILKPAFYRALRLKRRILG